MNGQKYSSYSKLTHRLCSAQL